jgi:dTDP-4-dehydrorhamnose reductase
LVAKTVLPVASAAFPTAARRPLNSRLDTTKLQAAFGLRLPDWKMGVARLLKEIEHEITH